MSFKTILYEKADGIATLTLNRPEESNAINDAMLEELDTAFIDVEQDTDIRVLVIKGAGKDFSIGHDLNQSPGAESARDPNPATSARETMEAERAWNRRWEIFFNLARPTIAQVHGKCLGTGFYLAMLCDLVVASEDATFGDPSLAMGMMPTMPLLTYLIGLKKAKELTYFGRTVDGREAEKLFLINKAVPSAKLEDEVNHYAKALTIPPADGMVLAKETLNSIMEVRGLGAAWRHTTNMGVLARSQEADAAPGEFDFFAIKEKKGLQAALEERDRLFRDLF